VGFFLNHIGGSPYYNINTTYRDGSGYAQNSVTYVQFWASNTNVPAQGSFLTQTDFASEVAAGLQSGALAYDPNTLYLVFVDDGVGLVEDYACAYHSSFAWPLWNSPVQFAAMPLAFTYQKPPSVTSCQAGRGSPNQDSLADAEVNVIAHETEETNTDPSPLSAWYDQHNQENADKCAWAFGNTYTVNGAQANQNIGGKSFLIQMNWVTQYQDNNFFGCVPHWP